jgi:hypothetical protein
MAASSRWLWPHMRSCAAISSTAGALAAVRQYRSAQGVSLPSERRLAGWDDYGLQGMAYCLRALACLQAACGSGHAAIQCSRSDGRSAEIVNSSGRFVLIFQPRLAGCG